MTRDDATSPVVGVLLLLPIAVSLALAVALWASAHETVLRSERQAAERAAWCTTYPDLEWPGAGECPPYGPRGWECELGEVATEALKCVPVNGTTSPDGYTLLPAGGGGS